MKRGRKTGAVGTAPHNGVQSGRLANVEGNTSGIIPGKGEGKI
tara:strand:+ start:149 stop:277 length:129 start_codon:yes stop_codon:yes gene_type:complete